VSKNNNDWNGNNQNPWGQKNSRQDFENPFNGLQKLFLNFCLVVERDGRVFLQY
jgi:hypothetical protein